MIRVKGSLHYMTLPSSKDRTSRCSRRSIAQNGHVYRVSPLPAAAVQAEVGYEVVCE